MRDSLWLWRAGSQAPAVVQGERRLAPSLVRGAARSLTHVGSCDRPSWFMRTHSHVWSIDHAHETRVFDSGGRGFLLYKGLRREALRLDPEAQARI